MTSPSIGMEHLGAFGPFAALGAETNLPDLVQLMISSDLPENLLRLIQTSIPTFSAAELLLFLVHHSERSWKVNEVVRTIRPVSITASAVEEYVALFKANGFVREDPTGHYQYVSGAGEQGDAIAGLELAYNERPVTLIRTICALADHKIQSFADSFKLKKDDPNERRE